MSPERPCEVTLIRETARHRDVGDRFVPALEALGGPLESESAHIRRRRLLVRTSELARQMSGVDAGDAADLAERRALEKARVHVLHDAREPARSAPVSGPSPLDDAHGGNEQLETGAFNGQRRHRIRSVHLRLQASRNGASLRQPQALSFGQNGAARTQELLKSRVGLNHDHVRACRAERVAVRVSSRFGVEPDGIHDDLP
jgi:hypothetical protein